LRNADWAVLEAFLARAISSFLISNGLKASNFFNVESSAMFLLPQGITR
jgi:hypothetical protein